MADTEVGGPSLGHIAAPAASDRVPLSTGSAAGGYSHRDEFVYKGVDGSFHADAPIVIAAADQALARLALSNTASGGRRFELISGIHGASQTGFSIRDATAGATRVVMDSSGNLCLGSGNPSTIFGRTLQVSDGSGDGTVSIVGASGSGYFATVSTNFVAHARAGMSLLLGANDDTKLTISTAGHLLFGHDGTQNLGGPSNRGGTAYFVTGAINTCDERDKAWREMLGIGAALFAPNLYEAEVRAGLRIIDEIGVYQWNDAIALKGPEDARPHVGPRAQRVWAICAEEGLCPALVQREPGGDWLPPAGSIPPAFLCFDEWGEETAPVLAWWKPSSILGTDGQPIMVPCEEGEEGTEQRPTGETYVKRPAGNRFGVRIDQLHSLMIAALNAQRLAQAEAFAALTTRVAALEPAA